METEHEIHQEAKIENVSDTALWVANYRAIESEREDAVFRDPYASILVGERGRQIAKSMAWSKLMSWIMVVRTTAIDRLILVALQNDVDMVINLGAGLDTRPYRMALPAHLQWIEVDFPQIIELKNKKLKDEKPVCRLERITLDLSNRLARQNLFSQLNQKTKRALIITEGVIPYLSNEEVDGLCRDLSAQSHFQYWIQDFYDFGEHLRRPKKWSEKMKAAPFKFAVSSWFDFFAERGWITEMRISSYAESKAINRPAPFLFPWSLINWIFPKKIRQKYQDARGYVLFRRQ